MRQTSRAGWSVVLGLAALLAGGSGPISASQTGDPFVFRSGVEAVQLDAFVTDRRGNPVTDLTADDFEIVESGQPQTIESFWPVDIPLVRARTASPTAPPIGPAAEVFANGQDHGRIYVIVLGDVSWQGALRARQHLQRFLEDHFGDTDLATVVSLTHGGTMRFTSDRSMLASMAGHVFAGRDENGLPFQQQMLYPDRAREQTRLFGLIAEALAGIPARRKAILLIS
jgi:VWFA-related protein